MKLRIQDNSLRLRLNKKEVACLRDLGSVESAIRFSANRVLAYSVTSSPDADAISVRYEGDLICVFLPTHTASEWAKNDEVTLEGSDSGVHIVVEKDFQCLHRSGSASDSDAYPNPLAQR